jgi:hypothetical protein
MSEQDSVEHCRETLSEELKFPGIVPQQILIHSVTPGGQTRRPPDDLDAERLGY